MVMTTDLRGSGSTPSRKPGSCARETRKPLFARKLHLRLEGRCAGDEPAAIVDAEAVVAQDGHGLIGVGEHADRIGRLEGNDHVLTRADRGDVVELADPPSFARIAQVTFDERSQVVARLRQDHPKSASRPMTAPVFGASGGCGRRADGATAHACNTRAGSARIHSRRGSRRGPVGRALMALLQRRGGSVERGVELAELVVALLGDSVVVASLASPSRELRSTRNGPFRR